VLYTALILLIILTIIAVAAARLQTGEAVMARNEHNHQLAMQAAEAALRDAETNLVDGTWSVPQFAQNASGLYVLQTEVQGSGGWGTNVSIADNPAAWTAGNVMTYTGPALSNAPTSPTVAQVVIENLPPVARAGDPLCTPSNQTQSCSVYRVTARAVGGDSSASATLQSVIH
jgi:type IV pilus assembly protein PilX